MTPFFDCVEIIRKAQKEQIDIFEQLYEENTDLKKKVIELEKIQKFLVFELIDANNQCTPHMADCRICRYDNLCERKRGQCDPDTGMCEKAILRACKSAEAE